MVLIETMPISMSLKCPLADLLSIERVGCYPIRGVFFYASKNSSDNHQYTMPFCRHVCISVPCDADEIEIDWFDKRQGYKWL